MISFFNKLGDSLFAKVIFFLLGISMLAFWGLGGLSNISQSDLTAVTVGKRSVSVQELGQTFDVERDKMSRISGGYMTPKRALQAGLLDQVVQQLILRELNQQIQDELGLIASDGAVRRYVETNPVFVDNLGHFDANLFYAYLSGMNMSQTDFAHQMRSELANQHLARTLLRIVPRDPNLMKRAAQAKKEKREVVGLLLTSDSMKVGTPSLEQLKEYYEGYQEEFIVPEYRTVRVVTLKPADFKNDYDQMYEMSRTLEDLLGAGQTLKEACTELKLNAGKVVTTDLSGHDKNGKEIREVQPLLKEIFSLSEGESTSLGDVEGGFVVAGVEKITPLKYKDFDMVRDEVAKLWQREQQKTALTKTAESLWQSVQQGRGWIGYTPKNYMISATESAPFPKAIVSALLQQKVGPDSVRSFPTEEGIWVTYVNKTIPSTAEPNATEKQEAVQDWSLDLTAAVQHAYAAKYPIQVHTNAIQKAFSIYDSQED